MNKIERFQRDLYYLCRRYGYEISMEELEVVNQDGDVELIKPKLRIHDKNGSMYHHIQL